MKRNLTDAGERMSRFKLPEIKEKRAQQGLRKQIISIFSIEVNESGPTVELIATPYAQNSLFNDREISILFSVVTMLEVKEMIIGELKLLFEIYESKMSDGRPSKRVIVTVCGEESNSGQIRAIVRNIIHSSDTALKNLKNIIER